MFVEIGNIINKADETSLQFLALFRDSISEIRLNEPGSVSSYFKPEYSHYLIVHSPFNFKYPENRTEWNLRFCGDIGVSIVEIFSIEADRAYVKGLMAFNGSKIYSILPFTSIEAEKAEKAHFPEDRMSLVRKRVFPAVLRDIKGETILDVGSGFGSLTIEIAKNNPNSKVYGIDLIESLIGQAQMNAEVLGVTNVEFEIGSVYELPFENEFADSVTLFLVLHHFEDIKSAISEVKRILKKSGQLTAVEPLAHQHHHGPQLSETEWKALFEEVGFHVETKSLEGAVVIRAKK